MFLIHLANVAAKKYIIALSELELSVQQLNGTDDMLKIVIDGNIFAPTGQTTASIVRCPNGQGRMMFLCGKYKEWFFKTRQNQTHIAL